MKIALSFLSFCAFLPLAALAQSVSVNVDTTQVVRKVKWTPKVGQRGTVPLNQKGTVTHVQQTTPA